MTKTKTMRATPKQRLFKVARLLKRRASAKRRELLDRVQRREAQSEVAA